jgi:hypothetical protein
MKASPVLLLLLVPGCSPEAPPVLAARSVWWAPLAGWNDGGLIQPVLTSLAEKGIDALFAGGHGERIWVPWERHAEAAALLRASPYASRLRIHTVLAGPRPEAFLPKRTSGDDGAAWTSLVVFTTADVPVEALRAALLAENIESGVVAFAGAQGEAHLYVPPTSVAAARRRLKRGPLPGLRIPE